MTDVSVTGSCLCGSVKYTVTGKAKHFYHCHCQRCRKATGTGHASNLLITPGTSIKWSQGEESLSRYKVPEAERFYNCFCQNCGSPMPRVVPELNAVIIPAGSLDIEAPISPQAHIFWDSRAQWSCQDDLPVFSEQALPQKN
ncbi:MAG: GFA family protein [Gammaproteobacteria bacterium]|nr:GFA family protein [Gammaproteobacteria bacterium]